MKYRGEFWTTEEVEKLKSLYESGLKIADISVSIGRSESAVTKKVSDIFSPSRRNDWTVKELSKLAELFDEGLEYSEIAKEMNRSVRSCQAKAVRMGLKKKECNVWKTNTRDDIWTNEEIDILKSLCESGKSAAEISDEMGRSKKAVFAQLRKNNLKIQKKSVDEESRYRRVFHLDDDYFETIDTQTKAYFLGWMITDGWVDGEVNSSRGVINSGRVGLKIKKSDIDVLEHFKSELKSDYEIAFCKEQKPYEYTNKITGKTCTIKGGERCSLTVTSPKMQRDLAKYGVVPRKTYDVTFPNELPEQFYPGFIAGVISGDGSVNIKNNHDTGTLLRCNIAGTKPLLIGIKDALVKGIGFSKEKKISKVKESKNLFTLELSQTETVKMYLWMKNNGISLMNRKNKIIEDYMRENKNKFANMAIGSI